MKMNSIIESEAEQIPESLNSLLGLRETTIFDIPFPIWEYILQLLVFEDNHKFNVLRQFTSLMNLRLSNRFFFNVITKSRVGFSGTIYGLVDLQNFRKGTEILFGLNPNWFMRFIKINFWDRAMTSDDVQALDEFFKLHCQQLDGAVINISMPGLLDNLAQVGNCFGSGNR